MRVGFVGVGVMGAPIARNILRWLSGAQDQRRESLARQAGQPAVVSLGLDGEALPPRLALGVIFCARRPAARSRSRAAERQAAPARCAWVCRTTGGWSPGSPGSAY